MEHIGKSSNIFQSVILLVDLSHPTQPFYQYPASNHLNPFYQRSTSQFSIVTYPDCKGAIGMLYPEIQLIIYTPSLPDKIMKHLFQEAKACVYSQFPKSEQLMLPADQLTPREWKSPLSSNREVHSTRQEKVQAIQKILNPLFERLLFKLNPLFLYQDENFESSSIVYSELILPLVFGQPALRFVPSDDLSIEIQNALSAIYSDIVVPIHQILTVEGPSAVITEQVLLYRGYVISGGDNRSELEVIMKIYCEKKFYLRTSTFPQYTSQVVLTVDGQKRLVGIIGTRASVLFLILQPLKQSGSEYDPYLLKRGLRVAKELEEQGIFRKLDEELNQHTIRPEVYKSNEETDKGRNSFGLSRRSRSVSSSPLGSPKNLSQKTIVSVNPAYYGVYDVYLFHYVLVNYKTHSIHAPIMLGSPDWFFSVMRPLYVYYSQLLQAVEENQDQKYFEFSVGFSLTMPKETIAVISTKKFAFFCMYRGLKENLLQLAIDLSINQLLMFKNDVAE